MSNIQNIKNEPRNLLLALTPQTCMSILQYIYVSNIFDLFHHAKGNMHHASSTILGSNFDIEVLDICESRNWVEQFMLQNLGTYFTWSLGDVSAIDFFQDIKVSDLQLNPNQWP